MTWYKLFLGLIIAILMIITIKMCGDAIAHEGNGFKHLKGSTGPIIGMVNCDHEIRRWTRANGTCIDVIFAHEILHIKELSDDTPKDERGVCQCDGHQE